jgi:hypothetical protein
MPKYPSMTKEDRKWKAECDASTLAEAEMIKGDPERLAAAQKCATEKAKIKEEEAENLKKVASGKISYSVMPKEKE